MKELNEFSKNILSYIRKEHPELISYINTFKSDFEENDFIIELQSNNKNLTAPLSFSTEDYQLTIGFHNFHCHFPKEYIKEAMELFYGIKNEKYLVVNYGLLEKEKVEQLKKGKIVDNVPMNTFDFYITSWSGRYDDKFENKNLLSPYKTRPKNHYNLLWQKVKSILNL